MKVTRIPIDDWPTGKMQIKSIVLQCIDVLFFIGFECSNIRSRFTADPKKWFNHWPSSLEINLHPIGQNSEPSIAMHADFLTTFFWVRGGWLFEYLKYNQIWQVECGLYSCKFELTVNFFRFNRARARNFVCFPISGIFATSSFTVGKKLSISHHIDPGRSSSVRHWIKVKMWRCDLQRTSHFRFLQDGITGEFSHQTRSSKRGRTTRWYQGNMAGCSSLAVRLDSWSDHGDVWSHGSNSRR